MNNGENRSSRSYGCVVRVAMLALLVYLLISGIHGCVSQMDAEAKANAAWEAMREPTATERRSEEIRDWMLSVGYDSSDIISSDLESIVDGRFMRGGITYYVRVHDSTPEAGDNERIAIWARNSIGDVSDVFEYQALGAPTPDTAVDNYTTKTVSRYQ